MLLIIVIYCVVRYKNPLHCIMDNALDEESAGDVTGVQVDNGANEGIKIHLIHKSVINEHEGEG